MNKVAELLDPALRKLGVRAHVRDAQVREIFAEVVGAALAPMCGAVRLDGRVLVVATSNSPLAHQLQLDSPKLIASINERLGDAVVNRLRFTTMDALEG